MLKKFFFLCGLVIFMFLISCGYSNQDSADASVLSEQASLSEFDLSKYGRFDDIRIRTSANFCNILIDSFGYEFADDIFEERPQVYLQNSNFPGLDFFVYPYRMDMTENHTWSDVLANGFGSYHVNAAYCSSKPDMSWGGLSFGAGANDIIDIYGEPDYYDIHDLHIVMGYDFGNCELNFRVYDSNLSLSDCESAGISDIPDAGLQGVDFYLF